MHNAHMAQSASSTTLLSWSKPYFSQWPATPSGWLTMPREKPATENQIQNSAIAYSSGWRRNGS
ncbi:MAG: hypothetical protein AMXMBFR84_43160 [Candidatus Hydrogenedentota bacterium]